MTGRKEGGRKMKEALSERQMIDAIDDYLYENYRRDLKLIDISRATSLGLSFIKRRYRQIVGYGVIERLHQIRIDELTRLHEKDVAETGFAKIEALILFVGYNNYQTFYRNFVKINGLPPKPFLKDGERKTAAETVVPMHTKRKKIVPAAS